MILEELTSLQELESLRPEWDELWRRCPSATPFQSPAWLIPWWKHLGQGELRVWAVWHENTLAALAPFFVWDHPDNGERQMLLLGTGVSDYLEILYLPEHAQAAIEEIFSALESSLDFCDVCDLQQLRAESPLLATEIFDHWKKETSEVCPVLRLPAAQQELPNFVPPQMLAKLEYYRQRASKIGTMQIQQASRENFEELFENFLRLHSARWQARGARGALAPVALRQFHREAAPGFLADGTLRLYGLRLGGQIVAALYGFTHCRGAFYYLSGFDPALKNLSLGTILIGHAIKEAIRENVREFDFLRGPEPYKYAWGAKDQWTYRRRLIRSVHGTKVGVHPD